MAVAASSASFLLF